MQFIKNISIYLIEIIIIHLNIILCFWTLVLCSGLTFEVPVKVRPIKMFILYRFKKKIDRCIKIKLFLNTFQIYNHLLTEIIIKRIIWHQRREHLWQTCVSAELQRGPIRHNGAKKKLQLKRKNSLFTLQTFHYNYYWWSQSLLNRFGWEIYAFQR